MLYVISASYDFTIDSIVLRLYNDETEKIEDWIDSDYKAYFLNKGHFDRRWKSVIAKETVRKYDALRDETVELCKVVLDSPNAVKQSHELEEAYENHIKFYQGYIYDNDIKMGMPYVREDGILNFHVDQDAQDRIQEILNHDEFKGLSQEEQKVFETWSQLLEYTAPNFKRASLDIEVWGGAKNQVPSADSAILPVIAACLASNTGERIALILIQEGKELTKLPENITKVLFFSDEKELLKATFNQIQNYPFILTFNGDDFDLKYLHNRALRLGIPKEEIPIILRRNISLLEKGIHIDLYKFFFIKAMRIYAFAGKYKNVDLDSVAKALLGRGKIDSGWINDLDYYDLTKYCMNDAEITLDLTTYNDNLVMNLILTLQRMSRMPIENVSRKSVSSWIRSFVMYEHRRRNILIPKSEDIKELKGQTKSEAIIKGKKYKGAVVFDPVSGTYFDVLVLDFASLYPSIIKVYNIGYSTINCPHEECKDNTIGELPHWICKRIKALESLLIGSLRDLRVFWYKPKAKDKKLDSKLMNWYKVAEQSIKVIMNATYGVFGAESFVFYCPPLAEEITAIARHIIEKTAEKAESLGIKVLGGDTDSIFVVRPSEDKLKELIEWTQTKYGIEFEVDKTYRYMCLSDRKKNYFGVFTDGTVDVKGLTAKKKHTPLLIKNTWEKIKGILAEIRSEEDLEEKKRELIKTIKETYLTLKLRKWDNIKDLAFHVTMSKSIDKYIANKPQHVKAAQMLIDEGYAIEEGTEISFVKTKKRVKLKRGFKWEDDVKPIQLAGKEDVNVDKYIEFLESTCAQIIEPMDIDFDENILGLSKLEQWIP